jgi:hypothetical protein
VSDPQKDYAGIASNTMAQASNSYAAMDKKRPEAEEGSWVTDAAFAYGVAKETGLVDAATKQTKKYVPRLRDFLSSESINAATPGQEMQQAQRFAAVDPTTAKPGQNAPGMSFASKAPAPTTGAGVAPVGNSATQSVKGMVGAGTGNAAQNMVGQGVAEVAAEASTPIMAGGLESAAGGVGTGVAEGALASGAAGAAGGAAAGAGGAALAGTAAAGTTAMVGGLSTAAGGMGAAAAAGAGAAASGAATGAAAGSIVPGVGTVIGMAAGALIASFL